jgi:hypothetical protein
MYARRVTAIASAGLGASGAVYNFTDSQFAP